jgi:hypothetical protein
VSAGGGTITSRMPYNFTINATNDCTYFFKFAGELQLSSGTGNYTLNLFDEEEHYPINLV